MAEPRFLQGDELGNIKSLRYTPSNDLKTNLQILREGPSAGKTKSIQGLSVKPTLNGEKLIAAACADGFVSVSILKEDDQLELLQEWKETRLSAGQCFVGLSTARTGIYSCSSNGALRRTALGQNDTGVDHNLASLPLRLCDWRLSPTEDTFAYGGDEVDLSVWNIERAFAFPGEASIETDAKKRKRGEILFSAEIWRAKNLPNDHLGLRQPIHVTSLTYLGPSSSSNHHHLLAGNHLGDVRRYDTRAARRPVADWKGIGKLGGVKKVEKGFSEHEVFVADKGCNFFSIDLRNGNVLCGYKGLSGAVTSIAPTPNMIASTALDRFARIHSTSTPPEQAGQQVDRKGTVLEKVYTKSVPTVIVWDEDLHSCNAREAFGDPESDESVWDGMEDIGDSDDEMLTKRVRHKNTKK